MTDTTPSELTQAASYQLRHRTRSHSDTPPRTSRGADMGVLDLMGRLSNPAEPLETLTPQRVSDDRHDHRTHESRPDRSPAGSQREAPKEAGEQSNTVQRRLSPADVDELIAAYCAGTGISELAMRFRLHRTAVAAHLGRHCVERHGIAKAWTEDVLATAAALYESGRSLATVGAALGVDASTVANRFCTVGVPIRARRGWPQKEPGN